MKLKKKKYLILGLLVILFGLIGGMLAGGVPVLIIKGRKPCWSIGIYVGESPISLQPAKSVNNPMLTPNDVTDVPAQFVADPFMVKEGPKWYMFFEVGNTTRGDWKGEIGLATSDDGLNWTYEKIVLAEPYTLSFPQVFKFKNDYYMIPESAQARCVQLYKADKFPWTWSRVSILLNQSFSDPAIIYHNEKWWLFVSNPGENDVCRLFYADNLQGPWTEHPMSPIVNHNPRKSRAAGRLIIYNGHIIRYCQNCFPVYGTSVRAFEITQLSTAEYAERELPESPILKGSGEGWNSHYMHHVDPYQIGENRWIAAVDGSRKCSEYKLIYIQQIIRKITN